MLRLALYAAYALVVLTGESLELRSQVDIGLLVAGVVLWLGMLGLLWSGLAAARDRRAYLLSHLGYPVGLAAGLLVGRGVPWLLFFVLVVGYVLLLRTEAAGHGFAFSLGLVAFVGVVAALTMVYLEQEQDDAQLRTPGDAALWAFASLLRVSYGRSLNPVTDNGRVLATVVGVCAVLAASMFTAQVVAWIVGTPRGRGSDREQEPSPEESGPGVAASLDRLTQEVSDLRAEVARLEQRLDGRGD